MIVAIAAIVNIALNYWWIPIFGVMGSAYATVMAYVITLGLSMYLGRKFIKISILNKETIKILFAALCFFAILWGVKNTSGYVFWISVLSGGLSYILILLGVNFMDGRGYLQRRFMNAREV